MTPTIAAPLDTLDAVQRSVEVPMSEGVKLIADVWDSDPYEPRPVVLERTPYDRQKTDQAERRSGDDVPASRKDVALRYGQAGFAYCVQDCRGTGQSDGVFEKYVQEGRDTAQTISWIRQQPWCDGRVVMVGFSYGAACQLAAMATDGDPPDAAILDCGGFSDALTSGIRQGGALALKQATWSYAQALRDAKANGDEQVFDALLGEDLMVWLKRGPWVGGNTPLSDFPHHQANLSAMWQHATDGPYWDRPGLRTDPKVLGSSRTRALFVTSWFDTSLRATIENHVAMASPPVSCPPPELIIGPWSHGDRWSSVAGEVDLGVDALPEHGLGASFQALRCTFLRQALLGNDAPVVPSAENARVHYFELGGDGSPINDGKGLTYLLGGRWRHASSWPPAGAQPIDLFLSKAGLVEQPSQPSRQTFRSDPDDPVPTLGGAINSGGEIMPGGMFVQTVLDERDDILRYETAFYGVDQCVAGALRVCLWVEADAPDIDVVAKLVLILADGTSLNLSDGICRARHRDGMEREVFLPHKEPTRLSVDLNPIAVRVRAGQKLRLDLAGSNFPCFDINPQTGAPQGRPSPKQVANITVLSGPDHPSHLRLMVMPI